MDEFRSCTVEAMQDLRPDDFPKAPLLLAGGVNNDADSLGQLTEDLDQMIAESGGNAMLAGDRFMQGILDWANETATRRPSPRYDRRPRR